MKGFKNEKELWQWQKKYLPRTFDRYEIAVGPAGHPDVKGSYCSTIIYIENKVGDYIATSGRRAAMESSQVTYLDWLHDCGQPAYVCFGSQRSKSAQWYLWPILSVPVKPPPGWTGPK